MLGREQITGQQLRCNEGVDYERVQEWRGSLSYKFSGIADASQVTGADHDACLHWALPYWQDYSCMSTPGLVDPIFLMLVCTCFAASYGTTQAIAISTRSHVGC